MFNNIHKVKLAAITITIPSYDSPSGKYFNAKKGNACAQITDRVKPNPPSA